MLKELRATCILMLLFSMHLLPMKPEDQFSQEHKFHQKLIEHNLIQNGTQSYYKKINPITSNPPTGIDKWKIAAISIGEQKLRPTINGIYTHGNISFAIDPAIAFNQTEPLDLSVTHGEKNIQTRFANIAEKKVPVLPVLTSLKDISDAIRNNTLPLIHYVTLKGIVRISGEKPCVILIEGRNQCAQPITLRGMELVCKKDEQKTKIFFDFADTNNDSVNYFNPIECSHEKIIADEKIVCVKDHKIYACAGKEIYGFFDSLKTRDKWAPDESNFYDQDQHKLLSLPSCYSDLNDRQETLKKQIVWVFGDDHNSFYQLDGAENLKNSNNYIYSNGGLFFVTLPYKATYKECFSHDRKELDYLVQVPKPHIVIRDDMGIEGGKRNWSTGVYEVICEDDRCSWHRIGAPVDDVINFGNKVVRTNTKFPVEPLSTSENKQWCDAAQRFFSCFATKIHSCNQEIANGFRSWNNLAKLNLSQVQLENGLQWKDVFISLSTMTQLTSLRFENNHPVADLLDSGSYVKIADEASDYYSSFGACLKKLIWLKELHLPGLWLKAHKYLGIGYDEKLGVISPELGTLTSIINHRKQSGIKAIIQSICGLKYLEILSIDGIPNHGHSTFSRQNYARRLLFAPIWIGTIPLQIWDAQCQDTDLKKLVTDSADQLAQMAFLKTISIYSSGGNCDSYLSNDFMHQLIRRRQHIRAKQYAKPVLSAFFVIPVELK